MNNPELQNYYAYKKRRDELVLRYSDVVERVEECRLGRLDDNTFFQIVKIMSRHANGSLCRYPENVVEIDKANRKLASDIERLEHICRQIKLGEKK